MAAEAVGYAIEFRAGTAVEEVVTETPRGKVSDEFGGAGGVFLYKLLEYS